MKSISKILHLVLLILFFSGLNASNPDSKNSTIHWHPFEWVVSQDMHYPGSTSREMLGSFQISGMPGNHSFLISLSTPFSHIYEDAFHLMIHRNPSFADKVENSQRVSAVKERVLRDIELSINREIIGTDNMNIVLNRAETTDETIKGVLGFGIFHRTQNILMIDNPGNRFAAIDELPETIELSAYFVPMRVEYGYLVIPVTINNREFDLFFDGSSRPGLVMFGNRATRQVASDTAAPENLTYITHDNQWVALEGFLPDGTIQFGNLPLGQFPVFRSNERPRSGIRGKISHPFFDDYTMIFDYKNGRFGIIQNDALTK